MMKNINKIFRKRIVYSHQKITNKLSVSVWNEYGTSGERFLLPAIVLYKDSEYLSLKFTWWQYTLDMEYRR